MGRLDTFLSAVGLQRREAITGDGGQHATVQVSGGAYRDSVRRVYLPTQAMAISAVYRCVDLISNGVATMPLRVLRYNRAAKIYTEFLPELPGNEEGASLDYCINVRPNERMTAYDFKKYTIAAKLLHGNALWVPVVDNRGIYCAIYLITPGCWSYDVLTNRYTVDDTFNGINGIYEAAEVFHFKNFCIDGGYMGVSTITWARETLSTIATAESETQKRIATGGRFKAFVTQSSDGVQGWGEYEDAQMEKMSAQLNDRIHEGADITFVPGRAEIKPYSMTNSDLEFLASKVFTLREIARFFGVPLSKMFEPTNQNYKSVDIEQTDFYSEAVQPHCEVISAELLAKTTNYATYKMRRYEWDTHALYVMDLEALGKWNKTQLETGQASVNDLRRASNIAPVEGGDEVMMSCNVAPLTSEKIRGGQTQTGDGQTGGETAGNG